MNVDIKTVSSFSELINRYGFLIVFGTISLIILSIVLLKIIKTWNESNAMRIKSELDKNNVEIEMMKKEKLSDIDQRDRLSSFVLDIQSQQIAQMQGISEVINSLKDEIKTNAEMIRNIMSTVNTNFDDMKHEITGVTAFNKDMLKRLDRIDKNDRVIMEKVTALLDAINQRNEDSNSEK